MAGVSFTKDGEEGSKGEGDEAAIVTVMMRSGFLKEPALGICKLAEHLCSLSPPEGHVEPIQ